MSSLAVGSMSDSPRFGSAHVLGMRDRFKMGGPKAGTVPAEMVNFHLARQPSVQGHVEQSMRVDVPALKAYHSVTVSPGAFPLPAAISTDLDTGKSRL
jgi:hypothetical protein